MLDRMPPPPLGTPKPTPTQELALAAQGRDRSRPKRRKLSELPPGEPLKVRLWSPATAPVALILLRLLACCGLMPPHLIAAIVRVAVGAYSTVASTHLRTQALHMPRSRAVRAQVTSASELLAAVADVADPAAARRRDKEAKMAAGQQQQQQQQAACAPSPAAGVANANGVRPTVSRMAAARTFYDLLVLSNRGYITLCKGAPPTTHGSGSGAGGSKEGVKRRGKGKGEDPWDGDVGKAGGAGTGQDQVDGEELYVVARARLTGVVVRGVGTGQGEGSKGANGAGGARTVNVVARAGPAA